MSARGYGGLDLCFAALYAWLGFAVAPSRSMAFRVALAGVIGLLGAAGVANLFGGEPSRVARRLGIVACSVLLLFTLVGVVLLASSCAFLFGVYGALGRSLGIGALLFAALWVELFGLLPLFQLRFHLAQGRR